MKSQEIRQTFLDFFKERGHTVIPSASLVPENDPTVLFTTAGMHPLVPYLLGQAHPSGSKRLASVQKCVRTQDIEDVGDARHLTFFEMLGNWSLGDYFKQDSIRWSWEFLTEKLHLDPSKIYVTVFAGDQDAPRDEESIALWKECFAAKGITAEVDKPLAEGGRIFAMAKDSNWWGPAGTTGPCGPDTEIYYDVDDEWLNQTLPDGMPDFESSRLLEIWNNVFMQYNKLEDGSFVPLAQQNVDTGMGLERIAQILQSEAQKKRLTIFEIDTLKPIADEIKKVVPFVDVDTISGEQESLRIITDHIRTSVMMIADGVYPSNKDRGYILRRLLRRAILHSQLEDASWVAPVVEVTTSIYKEQYPSIAELQDDITKAIGEEVAKFQKTIAQGKKEIAKRESLTGKDAFDLYQSYGFPLELTKEYALSKGVTIDEAEFETEFRRHQDLSRTASSGQFKSGLADHSDMSVRYHTATHLLHQSLRQILGDTVQQKGSNITPERLRFDFSWPEKMTFDQLKAVEDLVNEKIAAGLPVTVETMSPDAAHAAGALGFFGHKYGDSVTVYTMGDFSKEICTGPHVQNTKEVGKFHIAKEEAVSAGVRRIKATVE